MNLNAIAFVTDTDISDKQPATFDQFDRPTPNLFNFEDEFSKIQAQLDAATSGTSTVSSGSPPAVAYNELKATLSPQPVPVVDVNTAQHHPLPVSETATSDDAVKPQDEQFWSHDSKADEVKH